MVSVGKTAVRAFEASPLVSIIVISKDDPEGLRATLRSIAMQTMRDHEVVVVAKGSSAGVDPGACGLARAIRVAQASAGISVAFNEGLARARGQWVNFLNGGDSYRSADVLARMQPHLADAGAAIVTARAVCEGIGVRIPRDRSFRRHELALISHQASFFRRSLFERLGAYSPDFRIRMDFEWMLRVPPGTPVRWVDEDIVDFEAGGVSNASPVRGSLEELAALRLHRRGPLRIAALLGVVLPVRAVRHVLRRWRHA